MSVTKTLCYWLSCVLGGQASADLMQMITNDLYGAIAILVMLLVMVPCTFAPLFIDPRYNKDSDR
ncbi:MAG: hypothetical protein AAGI37_06780 [Planctomycetota bacterium]